MTVRFLRLTRGIVGRILTLLPIRKPAWKLTTDTERVGHHAVAASADRAPVLSRSGTVELVDCGQVSRRTRGLAFQLTLENVNPPFNRIYPLRS
jgi:hypothetical protein